MDGLIVGFCYHRVIRQAILKLKYYHVTALAQSLASQLSLHLMSHQRYKRMDQIAITHVPNHRRRRRMIK
jgi:predicted amidophosphoribosyltransferase